MRKGRKTRQLIMYGLIVSLVATTVAYAALQATLNINGTAMKKGGSWDIHFSNLSSPMITGDANVGSSKLELTSFTFSASVTKPLDSIVYTFDVVNSGTIDAVLDSVTLTGKNEANVHNINYTLTYKDGSPILEGDILKSGQTKNLKLSVIYNNVNNVLENDVTLKLGATLIYVQANRVGSGSEI